jgi:RHS repeat-associated protein
LRTVTSGQHSATYNYHLQSGLVSNILFQTAGVTKMTTTKSHDNLNRLTSIGSVSSVPSVVSSHTYDYNAANQRWKAVLADGSYWEYGYDALGQVTSGRKHNADGTLVAGQQFGYGFDDIGNRLQSTVEGQQSTVYDANLLNQYTNIVTTVTGQPPVPVAPIHDDDGNLTADGDWTYTWDAENRLIEMETTAAAVADGTPKQKLEFGYDHMSRRISKKVYSWDAQASVFSLQSSVVFVYDGWNLIAELTEVSGQMSVVRSHVWGLDLSGTEQGAGGVGGLLFTTSHLPLASSHFACFDGNGNVSALVDTATGNLAAAYEYDPFGNLIARIENPASSIQNPFLFSTKYTDTETGLLYYGYRYYQPGTGRWLSRDPLGEGGGIALFVHIQNGGINAIDPLGLVAWDDIDQKIFGPSTKTKEWQEAKTVQDKILAIRTYIVNQGWTNKKDAYVYTCGCGVVDLVHFMGLAGSTARGDDRHKLLKQQYEDEKSGNIHTAFPEDMPSNALGALFGEKVTGQPDDVIAEIKKYLSKLIQ